MFQCSVPLVLAFFCLLRNDTSHILCILSFNILPLWKHQKYNLVSFITYIKLHGVNGRSLTSLSSFLLCVTWFGTETLPVFMSTLLKSFTCQKTSFIFNSVQFYAPCIALFTMHTVPKQLYRNVLRLIIFSSAIELNELNLFMCRIKKRILLQTNQMRKPGGSLV